jgi:hypothetical protein
MVHYTDAQIMDYFQQEGQSEKGCVTWRPLCCPPQPGVPALSEQDVYREGPGGKYCVPGLNNTPLQSRGEEWFKSSPTRQSGGGSRGTRVLDGDCHRVQDKLRARRLRRREAAATEATTADLFSSMNILAWGVLDCVTGFCW